MKEEKPINEIVKQSLDSISQMIDTSKVIGKPIIVSNDMIVVPITKVTLGFGSGGSEFVINNKIKNNTKNELLNETSEELFPYGGGQVGGLSMNPEAFLIINNGKIDLIRLEKDQSLFNQTLDIIKEVIKK